MKSLVSALLAGAAVVVAAPAFAASDVVTIYSADGLHDGKGSWFETQFDAFTKATGVKVQYVEAGSGGVVERVAKEKSNPQADVLVTLPPFIQRAEAEGLLQKFKPTAADQIDGGDDSYQPLVNNFQNFIYDSAKLDAAPKTFADLLDPKFKGKIQYSTPGQAGDGTAVMLQVIHAFGSKDAAFDYLKKLQDNNVGPSSSTGKLTALVNKGELYRRQRRPADEPVAAGRQPEHQGVLAGRPRRRALGAAAALLRRPGRRRAGLGQRQEADRVPARPRTRSRPCRRLRSACRCART